MGDESVKIDLETWIDVIVQGKSCVWFPIEIDIDPGGSGRCEFGDLNQPARAHRCGKLRLERMMFLHIY